MTNSAVDILIVGAGPAGLFLAAQLAKINAFHASRVRTGEPVKRINYRIVDKAEHKVLVGHADGFQCRTVEVFQSLGIAHRVLHEGCEVAEVVFYNPDPEEDGGKGGLKETQRVIDTEPGTSFFRHYLLGQARIEQFLSDLMQDEDGTKVEQLMEPTSFEMANDVNSTEYPITVKLRHLAPSISNGSTKEDSKSGLYRSNLFATEATSSTGGSGTDDKATVDEEVVKAKYLVGCDGARSWLPTIRLKNVIHSAESGSILTVPRERGYVRFYVQLGRLEPGQRVNRSEVTIEKIIEKAQSIVKPYRLECADVEWYTCYEIGQRLCDTFDKQERVFIAGYVAHDIETAPNTGILTSIFPHFREYSDACHTHSPKAGQGMNTSMMDTYNLGWKLASVLHGTAQPSVLSTYQTERHAVANDLIEFDRKIAGLFSGKPATREEAGVSLDEFHALWKKMGKWTTGTAIEYSQSSVVTSAKQQDFGIRPDLATGILIGSHFENHPAICCGTAQDIQLQHQLISDGRWRIMLFPGDIRKTSVADRLQSVCKKLDGEGGIIRRYTRTGDIDSVIQILTVFATPRLDIEKLPLPEILKPKSSPYGVPAWDTIFADDKSHYTGNSNTYIGYGIKADRDIGCAVLVRPDQYVAGVWADTDIEKLGEY
ncbi:hypothetical protein QFC19_006680 [Naganishia cerealis]|uniref:Uncharacterized protein n=1 Tax=Naganishia cerealis TaxID=610337 RepID=A0ACC2VFW6_9TREE|nr:hypothetical protein QFC19_006680 [Naganishia cerealis]